MSNDPSLETGEGKNSQEGHWHTLLDCTKKGEEEVEEEEWQISIFREGTADEKEDFKAVSDIQRAFFFFLFFFLLLNQTNRCIFNWFGSSIS
mgnify:CR=1 FL=1